MKYEVGQTLQLNTKNLPIPMMPKDAALKFAEKAYIKLVEQFMVAGMPTGQWKIKRRDVGQWRECESLMQETFLDTFYVPYDEPAPEVVDEVNVLDRVID
jgi:hypothetical protein